MPPPNKARNERKREHQPLKCTKKVYPNNPPRSLTYRVASHLAAVYISTHFLSSLTVPERLTADTSVHAAELAISWSTAFFFFFLPRLEPDQPRPRASCMFFAALRSALLGFRVTDECERRPLEDVDGAESQDRINPRDVDSTGWLNDGSKRSTAGRTKLDWVGRGCRGMGARMGVSVRGPGAC